MHRLPSYSWLDLLLLVAILVLLIPLVIHLVEIVTAAFHGTL